MIKLMSNESEVDKLKLINGELVSEKAWAGSKKHIQNWFEIQKSKLNLIYTTCEIIICILILFFFFLKSMSNQKIHTRWYRVVNDEVSSTISQIVEQIEVIQEIGGHP